VAALLEAEGEGSYDADCGYDRERLEEIDGQLQQFHPDTAVRRRAPFALWLHSAY
jgi:hypothetical protein